MFVYNIAYKEIKVKQKFVKILTFYFSWNIMSNIGGNQMEESKQEILWNNLKDTNTLREVQKYIEDMNEVRGFNSDTIQDRMLLLTEEIGELAKSIRKTSKNIYTDINKQYNYDTIESEVADCFYVLLSVASYLNIDVFQSLKDKEKENINRVWKKN